jgi:hypothetical protein
LKLVGAGQDQVVGNHAAPHDGGGHGRMLGHEYLPFGNDVGSRDR